MIAGFFLLSYACFDYRASVLEKLNAIYRE